MLFFVGFSVMQGFALEFFTHGAHRPAITVFLKENKERKALNEALLAKKEKFAAGQSEQDLSGLINSKKPFTWEQLTYDGESKRIVYRFLYTEATIVPVSGGTRRLLTDVFGYVKPGTLTALMGASGAGKTTLLDVLANRKNIGVISGDVLIDGRKIGKDFQRGTACTSVMHTYVPITDNLSQMPSNKTSTSIRRRFAKRSNLAPISDSRRMCRKQKRMPTSKRLYSCWYALCIRVRRGI